MSEEDRRAILQAIARLEARIADIARGIESNKGALATIAPRLDTLTAEVREVARLVHRQANAVQALVTETDLEKEG